MTRFQVFHLQVSLWHSDYGCKFLILGLLIQIPQNFLLECFPI